MFSIRSFVITAFAASVSATVLNAQNMSSPNTSLAADSAWTTLESLLPPSTMHLGAQPHDSAVRTQYHHFVDERVLLLHALGSEFVQRFPNDPRICEWLLAAEAARPTPVRFAVHARPHAPLIGDFVQPIYADSVNAQMTQWDSHLPDLQKACVQSSSPDSLRVAIASEQVAARFRPVELDLWFPPDTTHPVNPDTVHWDSYTQDVLELGRQFPNITSPYVRNPAIDILDQLHRYHPAGESSYLTALEASPNKALQAVGRGKAALAEAQRTPMTMHVTGIDGKVIDLKNLRGKLVLLDFWAASWCEACRMEEPLIKAAYDKYHAQGLDVVGIALEDNAHRAFFKQYVKTQGIVWPQYFPGGTVATDNRYFNEFGFEGAPQLLLLDRNGLLIGQASGSPGIQRLEPLIKKQLGVSN